MMNNDWKDYLLSKGAQYSEDDAFRFNDEAADNLKAQNTDIICDLSQFNRLVVAGDDAATFMQGQFTNDVNMVDENNSQLNAVCNNKGRMIANFRLFKYQGNYFYTLKNSLADRSIRHLQNYILRSQVVIQDVSEQLIQLGVSGGNATELLSPFVDNITDERDSVSFNDKYIIICIADSREDGKPRYEILCSVEHAKTLWEKVSAQAETVNSSSWDYLNIQSGIPFIDSTTSEEFVPQMANMELINGVSFSKGCFTGQEIVARMHYLGKLKKRCYKIHIETDSKPVAGDRLFAEEAKAGQNTGMLIQAERNPESGYDALAVIQLADIESRLFLHDAGGPAVTVEELPYSFETGQA
jgi:tRNA-modifying protein YgfZ